MIPGVMSTAEELEVELGRQVRALRLTQNRTQRDVAKAANLSISTLQSLEYGGGSTLKTFIQVVRVLGRTEWLSAFAPPVTVSPMRMLRDRQRQEAARRTRARASRS